MWENVFRNLKIVKSFSLFKYFNIFSTLYNISNNHDHEDLKNIFVNASNWKLWLYLYHDLKIKDCLKDGGKNTSIIEVFMFILFIPTKNV